MIRDQREKIARFLQKIARTKGSTRGSGTRYKLKVEAQPMLINEGDCTRNGIIKGKKVYQSAEMNKPYLFIADSNEQGIINAGCLSSARKMPITRAPYAFSAFSVNRSRSLGLYRA